MNFDCSRIHHGLPRLALVVKNLPANAGNVGSIPGSERSLGQEGPMEEGVATHFSILAWRILRTEETGRLHPWVAKSQT